MNKIYYKNISKYIAHNFLNIRHYQDIKLIKHFIIKNNRDNNIYFKYKKKIYHIKIVNKPYKNIHNRMLQNYNSLMQEYEDYQIDQYILYVGDSVAKLKNCINRDELIYVYTIINLNDLKKKEFIKSQDISKVLLSILFNNKNEELFINKIINRLYNLSTTESQFKNHLKELELLARYKDLEEYIQRWESFLENNNYKNIILKSWVKKEKGYFKLWLEDTLRKKSIIQIKLTIF